MFSATLFGHRDFNYLPYREKIQAIIIDLIENHGVREFLSGFRGNFDTLCAEVIFDLKIHYPSIKNIMVLSYHNPQDFVLPKYFDESLYLLESRVPPRYAISYTNQEMILRADFVISGVCHHYGGAFTACNFAKRKKKIILDVFDNR